MTSPFLYVITSKCDKINKRKAGEFMSAIAYITNQEMIEFHRLNGNKTINFWRLGNTKKISFLRKEIYYSFYQRGTEKGKKKEL